MRTLLAIVVLMLPALDAAAEQRNRRAGARHGRIVRRDDAEEAPPYYSKPGALIRTTGQAPRYERAEEPRAHSVYAGAISLNQREAFDVGRAPGIVIGQRPRANPSGTSAAPNSP